MMRTSEQTKMTKANSEIGYSIRVGLSQSTKKSRKGAVLDAANNSTGDAKDCSDFLSWWIKDGLLETKRSMQRDSSALASNVLDHTELKSSTMHSQIMMST
eukprot:14493177-Ditylum_brightwellii.AAC.1